MKKNLYFFFFILFLICCKSENNKNSGEYILQATDNFVVLNIDEDTKIPYRECRYYRDINGKDYLAFVNGNLPEIIIYNLDDQSLYKKYEYEVEGQYGITGGFRDFFIEDLNNIYLIGNTNKSIYLVDSLGQIKERYKYGQTDDGDYLRNLVVTWGPISVIGNKIYAPQGLNKVYGEETMEKSRVGFVLDKIENKIDLLPLKFPPLMTYEELGTPAGLNADFYRCYDGKNFIYSFHKSELVYKVSPDHLTVEEFNIQSRYLDKIKRNNAKPSGNYIKAEVESSSYRHIIHDPYRKVYYRIAHPYREINNDENFVEISRFGKKAFSLIILNEKFEIIGETLLPDYTYICEAYIVREDGFYISCSHFKNPDYNDDEFKFQKFELEKKK